MQNWVLTVNIMAASASEALCRGRVSLQDPGKEVMSFPWRRGKPNPGLNMLQPRPDPRREGTERSLCRWERQRESPHERQTESPRETWGGAAAAAPSDCCEEAGDPRAGRFPSTDGESRNLRTSGPACTHTAVSGLLLASQSRPSSRSQVRRRMIGLTP